MRRTCLFGIFLLIVATMTIIPVMAAEPVTNNGDAANQVSVDGWIKSITYTLLRDSDKTVNQNTLPYDENTIYIYANSGDIVKISAKIEYKGPKGTLGGAFIRNGDDTIPVVMTLKANKVTRFSNDHGYYRDTPGSQYLTIEVWGLGHVESQTIVISYS